MDTSPITSMAKLAAEQHGAVSIKQLRAAGITARSQKTAVAAGWLVHVEPNVVVVW
jgi:hypothetical protein